MLLSEVETAEEFQEYLNQDGEDFVKAIANAIGVIWGHELKLRDVEETIAEYKYRWDSI